MHTRSTTKRLIEVGNGIYGFTSISETGEGIHTRFEYSGAPGLPTGRPDFKPSFSDYRSASATSIDSLSSVSSRSSSDQSIQLHMMSEDDFYPSVQTATSGRSEKTDEDQIFEREYETFMKNRDYVVDLTKKLIAIEELNEDMATDTFQMFTNANRPPIEEASQVTLESNKKAFGPEGTELIDEWYRPPPAEPGVYPQRWVTHRSTLLQSQPTEPNTM